MENTKQTIKSRLKKILKAIEKGSLKLEGGYKDWFCYRFDIQDLVWGRNLVDGWNVDVHHNNSHIGTIHIDGNLRKARIELDGEEFTLPYYSNVN